MAHILAWLPGEDQGMRAADLVQTITLKDPEHERACLGVPLADSTGVHSAQVGVLVGSCPGLGSGTSLPPPDRAPK